MSPPLPNPIPKDALVVTMISSLLFVPSWDPEWWEGGAQGGLDLSSTAPCIYYMRGGGIDQCVMVIIAEGQPGVISWSVGGYQPGRGIFDIFECD